MYENLVAFLLGKKSELSHEEMNEFMELLCKAMNVSEEYQLLEKESIIENIINSVNVKDKDERAVISDAIGNILMFNESSSESQEEDLFVDKSEINEPLKARKVKRGRFNKSKESILCENKEKIKEDEVDIEENGNNKKLKSGLYTHDNPSQIFKIEDNENDSKAPVQEALKNFPEFDFEIGDLEDNQSKGPTFDFKLDESE